VVYLGLNVVLTAVENLKPRVPESASASSSRPDDA
jgi:hypothetical protein